MKVLIFNENSHPVSEKQNMTQELLTDYLKELGHQVTIMETDALSIASCKGCFNCWLKTPGQCSINDDQVSFYKNYIQSDWIILISPVRKGFVSGQLLKTIERMIPLNLPFFCMRNGRMTHMDRYNVAPAFSLLLDFETAEDKANEALIGEWFHYLTGESGFDCLFINDIKAVESVKRHIKTRTKEKEESPCI